MGRYGFLSMEIEMSRQYSETVRLAIGRSVAMLALVVAAVAHIMNWLTTTQLLVLFAIAVVGIMIWTISPGDLKGFLSRLQKVSVGPLSAEVQSAAASAASVTPNDIDDESERDDAKDIFDLRMKLESKFTYLAKHVLASKLNGHIIPTYLTVGSLKNDHLLADDEAVTADAILTLRDTEFRQLPYEERKEFLKNSTKFVNTVHTTIFHAYVAQLLKGMGTVTRERRKDSTRDDLVVLRNGTMERYVPVFSTSADSDLVAGQRNRLSKLEGRSIIVLPSMTQLDMTDHTGRPSIISLADLLNATK